MNARKTYDIIGKTLMYIASSFSVITLVLIFYFVFSNGLPLLNMKIITGNNASVTTNLKVATLTPNLLDETMIYDGTKINRYGIVIKEIDNKYQITYIADKSELKEKGIKVGDYIYNGTFELMDDKGEVITYQYSEGLEKLVESLNKTVKINKLPVNINGQSIQIETKNIYHTYEMDSTEGYISKRYGIVLVDDKNLEGISIIKVLKIHEDSPMKKSVLYDDETKITELSEGDTFYNAGIVMWDDNDRIIDFTIKEGAEKMALALDQTVAITMLPVVLSGGGIRGSIITTLYLIVLTLMIALPIGILTAVYLHEMAPQNKVTDLLRSFVDMLTGVPSIIYGLMGAALFIPLTVRLFGDKVHGGSLISGSLTLAVIVLPVIIKSTESALDVVPIDYKYASLALGSTKSQTTFKVMLPNALPGILSATLLSIGRIMGESAALIYAIGTVVRDDISIFGNGTSLAVHIWSAMAGDTPNFALASTISIIILIVVLSLNVLVKLLTLRLTRKYQ